jgi:cytochrome c oxidase subunit I+III
VESRDPLWQNPKLREEVDSGQHYLPGLATGTRETIVTSAVDARPEYLLRLPGPSWLPVIAGVGTAVFFFALTVKQVLVSGASAAIVLAAILCWLWETEPPARRQPFDVGGGVCLPDHMTGRRSHAWWGTVVLMLVNGTVFASLAFAFFYLWTTGVDGWPPAGASLPAAGWSWLAAAAGIAAHLLAEGASRALRRTAGGRFDVLLAGGALVLWTALIASLLAVRGNGIDAQAHAFGATIHALLGWQATHVALVTLMCAYCMARRWRGMLDERRRSTFDNTWLMWHFTAGQGTLLLVIVHAPGLAT